jgi:hypothetical protein
MNNQDETLGSKIVFDCRLVFELYNFARSKQNNCYFISKTHFVEIFKICFCNPNIFPILAIRFLGDKNRFKSLKSWI